MTIVIDTREQRPWHFPPEFCKTERGTLNAGDYALKYDPHFAIERKSLDDFAGTIGSGWSRFQRELIRMQQAGHVARVVIIESNIEDAIEGRHRHKRINTRFMMKRISELLLNNISVVFGGDEYSCAFLAYSILLQRKLQLEADKKCSL